MLVSVVLPYLDDSLLDFGTTFGERVTYLLVIVLRVLYCDAAEGLLTQALVVLDVQPIEDVPLYMLVASMDEVAAYSVLNVQFR